MVITFFVWRDLDEMDEGKFQESTGADRVDVGAYMTSLVCA
jgi:hypothetical protein